MKRAAGWYALPIVLGMCAILAATRRTEKKSGTPFFASPVVAATQPEEKILKMPGPDVQKMMLGTFSIQVQFAPSAKRPEGETGEGQEIWSVGPGGRSWMEEFHAKSASGEMNGFGVVWWEEKAQGQRYVWCDNSDPKGCSVSKSVARWDGNRLVYSEDVVENGKKMTNQEIFSEITSTSFLQVLQSGPTGGTINPVMTIHATKVSPAAIEP